MTESIRSLITLVYPEEIKAILKCPSLSEERVQYLQNSLIPVVGTTGDLSANLTRMLVLTPEEINLIIVAHKELSDSYLKAELYMAYEHLNKRIKTLQLLL